MPGQPNIRMWSDCGSEQFPGESPHNQYTHVTFEAYYSKAKDERYNIPIMIANLSPIIEVDCN